MCDAQKQLSDPASGGALFILFSGLRGPADFTTYDVPTAAAWGAPKSGLCIARHGYILQSQLYQCAA